MSQPRGNNAVPHAVCVWPADLQRRLNISLTTRWKWEKSGRLPPRDFFIGGKAVGWHLSTLERAERGETVPA